MRKNSQVSYLIGPIMNTHAKTGQHHAELKHRFVDCTEWFAAEFINKAIVKFLQQISLRVAAAGGKW